MLKSEGTRRLLSPAPKEVWHVTQESARFTKHMSADKVIADGKNYNMSYKVRPTNHVANIIHLVFFPG